MNSKACKQSTNASCGLLAFCMHFGILGICTHLTVLVTIIIQFITASLGLLSIKLDCKELLQAYCLMVIIIRGLVILYVIRFELNSKLEVFLANNF